MSKNQFPLVLNWQSNNPSLTFLPVSQQSGSAPSGVLNGVMNGTDTIYSQIIGIWNYDNKGLEVTWTGTPIGLITVNCSNSGINFYPLTFTPPLTQPTGSGGGYLINLNQLPFRWLYIQYGNASGSGILTMYGEVKSLS